MNHLESSRNPNEHPSSSVSFTSGNSGSRLPWYPAFLGLGLLQRGISSGKADGCFWNVWSPLVGLPGGGCIPGSHGCAHPACYRLGERTPQGFSTVGPDANASLWWVDQCNSRVSHLRLCSPFLYLLHCPLLNSYVLVFFPCLPPLTLLTLPQLSHWLSWWQIPPTSPCLPYFDPLPRRLLWSMDSYI